MQQGQKTLKPLPGHPIARLLRGVRSYIGTNAALLLTAAIGASAFSLLIAGSADVYQAVAAGDGVSTHAFRHTCASDVLDHSGDLRVVQQMLGHSDLKTTAIYLRVAGLGDVRSAMEGRDYQRAMPDAA